MEKKPFIGQMDRRITIMTVSDGRNEIGEPKPIETELFSLFAKFEDLKTNTSEAEYVEGKVMHLMAASFTVRFRKAIFDNGTAMLLYYEGKKYRIEHVQEIGRRAFLKLYVKNYE